MAAAMTLAERTVRLEKQLSAIAGAQIEILVRGTVPGGMAMTASSDGDQLEAMQKLVKFMGSNLIKYSMDYDSECDQTCLWFELAC